MQVIDILHEVVDYKLIYLLKEIKNKMIKNLNIFTYILCILNLLTLIGIDSSIFFHHVLSLLTLNFSIIAASKIIDKNVSGNINTIAAIARLSTEHDSVI